MDNDSYGHVNNVTYYSYFDTAVNEHLIRVGGLDIRTSPAIGLVVETGCRFHQPLTFPEPVDTGLRVARLGTSSVTYEIGIFRARRGGARRERPLRPRLGRPGDAAAHAGAAVHPRRARAAASVESAAVSDRPMRRHGPDRGIAARR